MVVASDILVRPVFPSLVSASVFLGAFDCVDFGTTFA